MAFQFKKKRHLKQIDYISKTMVDFGGFLSDENEDFRNKAKSEEEIAKYCTKEDLSELARAVHLLKKGYEVQKLSVINNLDRYMKEFGSNEELLALIISSLDDWDDKMQIECAKAFIDPILNDRVTPINRQRILRLCVDIISNESNDNPELQESWMMVFDNVVGRVTVDFLQSAVLDVVADWPNPKNKIEKRQLGNRLFSGIGKNIGEENLDKVPVVIRILQESCQDMNYKIRMDGALWLKDYLLQNHEKLVGSSRFESVYLPEVQELLNDESNDVRIEAIEAILCVLQVLDVKVIEEEFIPNLIRAFNFEKNSEDNIRRVAKLSGQIAYKLSTFNLHLKFQEPILSFYKQTTESDDDIVQKAALYNLPCFHSLYKDVVKPPSLDDNLLSTEENKDASFDINFHELYQKFAEAEDIDIREVLAACIHEPYKIRTDDEDIGILHDIVCDLMEDTERKVACALAPNLCTIIQLYSNTHSLAELPDDDYGRSGSDRGLKHSNTWGINKGLSSMDLDKVVDKKKPCRLPTKNHLQLQEQDQAENLSVNSQYLILPEYKQERLYSEQLLPKVMIYEANLRGMIGPWREHASFLENLALQIHLFHLPEVHDQFAPILFNLIQNGNSTCREAVSKCIVEILIHQHDPERRAIMAKQVITDLAEAGAFTMRKCFISMCRYGAGKFTRQFFLENFFDNFMNLAKDKVPNVRIDFAKALEDIKPWFDNEQTQQILLSETSNLLRNDSDQDVADAAENTDFELLKSKKNRVLKLNQMEEQSAIREVRLQERNAKEEEERKRREEEQEENKFEFAFIDSKKNGRGGKGKLPTKKKTDPNKRTERSDTKTGAGGTGMLSVSKDGLKRAKNGVTKRNSSALPSVTEFSTIPKDKDRKNSVMLPVIASTPAGILDNKTGKSSAKPEEIIGGMDNYKKYQMLVQQQQMSGAGSGPKDFKRSNSLFDNQKKMAPKRTTTMDSQNRRKSNKITDNDSDDDSPPPGKKVSNAQVPFSSKR